MRDGVRTYEAAGVRQLLHDLEVRWVCEGVQALRVEEVPGDAVQCEAVEEHLSDAQLSVRRGVSEIRRYSRRRPGSCLVLPLPCPRTRRHDLE